MPTAKKKAPAAQARRTTHRSKSGKKLYAVRDSKGRFKDIQTYERAHRADLAKKARAEKAQAKQAAADRPTESGSDTNGATASEQTAP